MNKAQNYLIQSCIANHKANLAKYIAEELKKANIEFEQKDDSFYIPESCDDSIVSECFHKGTMRAVS